MVLFVTPNTRSFEAEISTKRKKSNNPFQDDFDEKEQNGRAAKNGETAENGKSFDSPFDKFLGVTSIPIYPSFEPRQQKQFTELLKQDFKRLVREENYKEVVLAAMHCGYDVDLTLEDWHAALDTCSSTLNDRDTVFDSTLIYAKEAEKIVLLALGTTPEDQTVIDRVSFEDACLTFAQTSYTQTILAAGSKYAFAFKSDHSVLKSLTSHEKRLLKQCLVLPDSVTTSFSTIGGLAKTKSVFDELIKLPLQKPELFQTGILKQSTTGILLFGPPGTGKTLLARAVAAESGANFLNVQMSHVSSMWVGENEKNVRALFSLARKLKPCVIFVDELDALLRARQSFQPAYATNTINEFMQEWDGIQSENSGVIVVGATNRPFDLDEAVLRRLPRRILVNLPDKDERREILKILLAEEALGDNDLANEREEILDYVAGITGNYSGSDLKNVCIAAGKFYMIVCEEINLICSTCRVARV